MSAFAESLRIRWIALGALLIFLSVFAGDRIITGEIEKDPQARAFLHSALDRVATDISDAEKQEIRDRAIGYLTAPSIIVVICVVLSLPFLVGCLLGWFTLATWNSVFAGLVASLLTVYVTGETAGGSLVGKRLSVSRATR